MANVERVVIANVVWRSALEEIASTTPHSKQVWLVAGSDLGFAMTRTSSENCEQVPSQTIFSKIKTHLKLSSKSVGQGRGGMEGTVRPSQLRAGSPPKKRIQKKIESLAKEIKKSPTKTSRRFMKLKATTLEFPLPIIQK